MYLVYNIDQTHKLFGESKKMKILFITTIRECIFLLYSFFFIRYYTV